MKQLSVALLTGVALAAGGWSSARADITIGAAGPITGEDTGRSDTERHRLAMAQGVARRVLQTVCEGVA